MRQKRPTVLLGTQPWQWWQKLPGRCLIRHYSMSLRCASILYRFKRSSPFCQSLLIRWFVSCVTVTRSTQPPKQGPLVEGRLLKGTQAISVCHGALCYCLPLLNNFCIVAPAPIGLCQRSLSHHGRVRGGSVLSVLAVASQVLLTLLFAEVCKRSAPPTCFAQ